MLDNPRSAIRIVFTIIAAVLAFYVLVGTPHDPLKILAGGLLALCVAVVV